MRYTQKQLQSVRIKKERRQFDAYSKQLSQMVQRDINNMINQYRVSNNLKLVPDLTCH